jgi:competence CoiA-like predicted nuclease
MKRFIQDKFNIPDKYIEYHLGFGKPDGYIEESHIAIEVQHSPISSKEFDERNNNYTKNNIYVLWIFHSDLISENISATIKKAHSLYFGRIYVYEDGNIIPIHFEGKKRYVEEYTDYYDGTTYGDYWTYYKKKRDLNIGKTISNFSLLSIKNNWTKNLIARFYDKRFWKTKDEKTIHDYLK